MARTTKKKPTMILTRDFLNKRDGDFVLVRCDHGTGFDDNSIELEFELFVEGERVRILDYFCLPSNLSKKDLDREKTEIAERRKTMQLIQKRIGDYINHLETAEECLHNLFLDRKQEGFNEEKWKLENL